MSFIGIKFNGGFPNGKPKKRFNASKHSAADVVCVSVNTSGGMDLTGMRRFTLTKADGAWRLEADFFLSDGRVELDGCAVSDEEAGRVISLIEESGAIKKLASYRPARVKVFAPDAPTYYSRLTFADGEETGAAVFLREIEHCLYDIAVKYAESCGNNAADE
ncbi:MAG: hypothetical protein ACI4XA_03165 [Oscillospiraceae bacterium]